eukprot:TRINITY_DN19230_c0_g1_i1.p1 TRINITY_DN19230_c0_g1~~TRINITY_DN19230_c0_g1_i1.p1  ORF type:complete len:340 (+),score=40.07 TRINITY_DN19230_c0_g1_i1:61-1080(+)
MSLEIPVETPDGSVHMLFIDPTTTVREAKEQLANELGLDEVRFDLVYQGDLLKPSESVMGSGISGGDTMSLEESNYGAALRNLGTKKPTAHNMQKDISSKKGQLIWYLQANVDPNHVYNDNSTPLTVAIRSDNFEAVKILLSHGAKVNAMHGKPLYDAVERNRLEIAELLLDHGADVKARSNPPIHFAVCTESMLDLLISRGADILEKDSTGSTILRSCEHLTHALLQRGADPHVVANDGTTPLFWTSNTDVVRMLLDRGVFVDHRNNEGYTRLFTAVRSNHVDMVKLLLNNGADPTQEKNHRTPLFWAMTQQIANLLISSGASCNPQEELNIRRLPKC